MGAVDRYVKYPGLYDASATASETRLAPGPKQPINVPMVGWSSMDSSDTVNAASRTPTAETVVQAAVAMDRGWSCRRDRRCSQRRHGWNAVTERHDRRIAWQRLVLTNG